VIPGKKYTPEDFLEIAWRRRWVIVLPFVLTAIGVCVWSYLMPDMYRSTAIVLVVPPQVPQNYVRPTVTEPLERRLETMQQEILSRPRLEQMIQEFGLYPEMRKEHLMEDVVVQMRRDIEVAPAKARRKEDPGSFEVSYESENPKLAQVVAERLASLFVRRNLETRAVQAGSTTQFLDTQLADARNNLREHERRLQEFRQANAGRLPTEVNANIQIMQATQQELQNLNASITADRDRQLTIERTISDEVALGSMRVTTPGTGGGRSQALPTTAAGQLEAARAQYTSMSLRLTEEHPEMRGLKRRIQELEKEAESEALQQPVSGSPTAVAATPADVARQQRIAGLRAEHESLERRLSAKREQAGRLQAMITDYRHRIEGAPALESDLTQLMRDYDTLDRTYTTLLAKAQDAKVAANLEERQVGEQFRLIEAPRVPERPTSPNRIRLNMMGSLAGIGLGLALAGLLEYRDRSLRTEDDVVLTLALPVLALVPTMVTTVEKKQRRKLRWVLASSGAVFVMVLLAVVAWKFETLSAWMR
jgi:polysaccharide chain length determinant protein (PEP-CTERM system associated)